MLLYELGEDGKTPVALPEGDYPSNTNNKIARDVLPDGKVVSTIFLSIDHSFDGGDPVLFETMVFPSETDFMDIELIRYYTWDESVEGHNSMVEKYDTNKQ